MSKLFSRATVSGTTFPGATEKTTNTALWDALNTFGLTDSSRTTVTTSATLVTTQCGLLLVDCTSGNITLTLPTSGAATDDAIYVIRRIDSGSNTLSVQRGGTDTVEGATTALSVAAGGILAVQMPAGATNWRVFNQSNVSSSDARAQTQAATAFTSAGTQPAYTLTPSPAIASLVSGQRFRVKVHSANSGAASTLAVNGLAATSIKQYDAMGNKVDPILAANQLVDMEYDGTHWVAVDPLPATMGKIQPITASVGGSALTVTINPTTLDFRSSTLTSGSVNTRAITSAVSVVVPSTATLGTVSAVQSRIAVLAIDNAGTVEAAVINIAGGVNLDETGVITTTTISSGATSASVAYSTTGRTNVAYRVVGYVESTQATAGTWATAPSTIQGTGGEANTAHGGAGFGQTYKLNGTDITRVVSTNYDNTTGKPITVICVFVATGGVNGNVYTVTATVGGKAVPLTSMVQGSAYGGGTFIVPPGMRYSIAVGTTSTIVGWSELS